MKGGQPTSVIFGGTRKRKNKMKGGSFAEVGTGASGKLTAGNGMGVTGAGEILTVGKLGHITANAGQADASLTIDKFVVTQDGGRRRHRKRKSVKRKRRGTTKRRGSKRKSAKRRSSKRKSRKH